MQAMCDIIAHRGPDSEGIWTRGPVGLGHRRLSILDTSEAGRQPMPNFDSTLVIVFNGEIYNYVELRRELVEQGCHFKTQSDTEVILEAYRLYGPRCVERFVGMWAFAIFDDRQQNVFVSRDRFGIKPFYYLDDNREFVFGSEIKAILRVRPEQRRVNEAYLSRLIVSGLLDDGEQTCFENVKTLPPAHSGTLDLRSGKFEIARYWGAEPEQFAEKWRGQDPVETLRHLMETSVRLHMRSDVPVGSCLSGGIDSSALVCLVSKLHGTGLHTFSGEYQDEGCDERNFIRYVNQAAGTIPGAVVPEPEGNLIEDLARITWHQDEPTAGPGLYTQYHVMRRARLDVKVVLDGQGADELFGGYLWYLRPVLAEMRRGGGVRAWARVAARLAAMRWHWGWNSVSGNLDLVLPPKLFGLLKRLRPGPTSLASPVLHPRRQEMAARPVPATNAPSNFKNPFQTLLYNQITSNCLPALLHYEDRNSMAHSIEARVPFLDHRIVEFAMGLDTEYKVKGTWTKWVLREAMSHVLPREIRFRRSKLGYATPMDRWLRKPSEVAAVEDVLFSPQLKQREIVNDAAVRQLWAEHQAGANHSWVLYRILTAEIWHRHYIDAFDASPAVRPAPLSNIPAHQLQAA
ncbi:MAG: asparagine synthase (glutamine-hydrolyzing) [Pirellulales bacterium]